MKPKAFAILPESQANVDFISNFPLDTEIAVLPDDVFEDLVERARALDKGKKTAPVSEFAVVEPKGDATEDVISELDIINVDGC